MVSDATLSSDVFEAVRTKLVTLAPYCTVVSEASGLTSTSAASIRAAYNDKEPARPQIIITPVTFTEDSFKFGSRAGKKAIAVNIDCYSKRTSEVDQLFDQIYGYMNSDSGDIDGVELIAVASEYGFSSASEAKYHVKSLTLTYDRE